MYCKVFLNYKDFFISIPLEENTISYLELLADFLIIYISFLKHMCGIWDWGLEFYDYVILI